MVCWRQTTVACEKCGYTSTHNIIVNNHKTPANHCIISGLAVLRSNQLGYYSIIWLVDWCFNCHLDANHWPTQNTLSSPRIQTSCWGGFSLSRTRAPFIKTISWDRYWAVSQLGQCLFWHWVLGHSRLGNHAVCSLLALQAAKILSQPSSRAHKNYVSSCNVQHSSHYSSLSTPIISPGLMPEQITHEFHMEKLLVMFNLLFFSVWTLLKHQIVCIEFVKIFFMDGNFVFCRWFNHQNLYSKFQSVFCWDSSNILSLNFKRVGLVLPTGSSYASVEFHNSTLHVSSSKFVILTNGRGWQWFLTGCLKSYRGFSSHSHYDQADFGKNI